MINQYGAEVLAKQLKAAASNIQRLTVRMSHMTDISRTPRSHLGEGAAQLDVRRGGELSLGAHGEGAGLQAVQVGHDQQQVRRGFDGKEAAAGDVYPHRVVEAFDRRADRRLQLDDVQPSVERLRVTGRRINEVTLKQTEFVFFTPGPRHHGYS